MFALDTVISWIFGCLNFSWNFSLNCSSLICHALLTLGIHLLRFNKGSSMSKLSYQFPTILSRKSWKTSYTQKNYRSHSSVFLVFITLRHFGSISASSWSFLHKTLCRLLMVLFFELSKMVFSGYGSMMPTLCLFDVFVLSALGLLLATCSACQLCHLLWNDGFGFFFLLKIKWYQGNVIL